MSVKKSAILLILGFIWLKASAQNDSIVVDNKNIIIGEVKSMNKGVLKMETSFSKKDFEIEWLELKGITTVTEFLISTTNGLIYNGNLKTTDNNLSIISNGNTIATIALKDVVYLRSIESDFWGRMSASLALGYNFTKSNNYSQFSLRSTLGYETIDWTLAGNFNGIYTDRNDTEAVKRLDGAVSYRYFLKNDWYPLIEVNLLSNSEQEIKLRTVTRAGMGKYISRTNQMYWGVQAGISYNNESFTDGVTNSQNSLEGFLGTELNIYDVGDLDLLTKVTTYPGITEGGRFRLDGSIDLQYDLPRDFFLKFGVTVNYDNETAQSGNQFDYVFQTSFGWEL